MLESFSRKFRFCCLDFKIKFFGSRLVCLRIDQKKIRKKSENMEIRKLANSVTDEPGTERSNVPHMSYFRSRTFNSDFGDILGTF